MNRRPFLFAAIVAIGAMLAISAYGLAAVPAGLLIAIHWGLDGTPDGWAPREIGLLVIPAIASVLAILLLALPSVEPRRAHLARSGPAYQAMATGVMVLLALLHAAIVGIALGWTVSIPRVAILGAGIVFVVIGNWLPKLRSNYTAGIRLPWTLSSERSWAVTHRLGGRGFVGLGAGLAGLAILDAPPVALVVALLGGTAILGVWLAVVAYRAWSVDPERLTAGFRDTSVR
jgi:uncharacterized membrane protein